jgi:hypothetical protein
VPRTTLIRSLEGKSINATSGKQVPGTRRPAFKAPWWRRQQVHPKCWLILLPDYTALQPRWHTRCLENLKSYCGIFKHRLLRYTVLCERKELKNISNADTRRNPWELLLQPKHYNFTHDSIQGKDWVISSYVLSLRCFPAQPTYVFEQLTKLVFMLRPLYSSWAKSDSSLTYVFPHSVAWWWPPCTTFTCNMQLGVFVPRFYNF